MCQHKDTRLVVDLSYDITSQALTWVVTGTDEDGQVQWLRDGHQPLAVASSSLMRALHDSIGGTLLGLGRHPGPFDD
jgi:hypothetical protein